MGKRNPTTGEMEKKQKQKQKPSNEQEVNVIVDVGVNENEKAKEKKATGQFGGRRVEFYDFRWLYILVSIITPII